VLNAMLQSYDNINEIRAVNDSLVSQVLNKCEIAEEICKQTNIAIRRP